MSQEKVIVELPVELVADKSGWYAARVPGVPTCAQGKTEEAAIRKLRNAIRLYADQVGRDVMLALVRSDTNHPFKKFDLPPEP